MAGLYIHVPFCKQACSYCNFHFSTNLDKIDLMVRAIIKELNLRKDYLQETTIDSIYFGGGTPSLLNQAQLEAIFGAVDDVFTLTEEAEVTLEANPDDLDLSKLDLLSSLPINRLSIGVQSFRDEDLIFMRRVHNAAEARCCIENSIKAGFDNLNVDLIYGIPGLDQKAWMTNLQTLAEYEVPHWSCYALTVESKTLLAHQIMKKKVPAPDDQTIATHFRALIDFAYDQGLDHYEISNFAKPNYLAVHNVNYWRQKPYMGLGPSAHSYDRRSRSWNIDNNARYLRAIAHNQSPATKETLTPDQQYNEYVMTGLRTKWGCSYRELEVIGAQYIDHFVKEVDRFKSKGWMVEDQGVLRLTPAGKLFADHIASELFIV